MVNVVRDSDAGGLLPAPWQKAIQSQLLPGEKVLGWLEPDLDERLQYAHSLVIVTDQRILASESFAIRTTKALQVPMSLAYQSWQLADVVALRPTMLNGLGTLELFGTDRRLAVWRYTAAKSTSANRLVQQYQAAQRSLRGEPEIAVTATVCPSCGATLPPGESDCPACHTPPEAVSSHSLFRLSRFAKPRMGLIVLGFALTAATTAVGLLPIYLTIPLVDDFLIPLQERTRAVQWSEGTYYFVGLLVLALVAWFLGYLKSWFMQRVGERVSADIRNSTYGHLQGLSLEYFGGKRTGDLMSRISSDTDRICTFISVHLVDFASDVLMIVMASAILISLNWKLALATLIPFPFIVWLIQHLRSRMRMGYARANRAWGEMVSVLADTIPGVRVVKAFAQESREIERFSKSNQHVVDANDRVNGLYAFFNPTVTLLTELGALAVWVFGAMLVFQGDMKVGILVGFSGAIGRFYVRLESMSRMIASTQRAAAATHRIFEVLDRVPSVPEPVKPVHPGRLEGRLEIKDISFQYGARRVIHNVSLTIEPGEMIGLVGPSGAGKSTLVNLVCRFYDVSEGSIFADGHDIRSYPVEEYRRNIGIVLQEPFLFYGTVAENIAYGRPDATQAEIVEAAKAAKAHDFILRLPDGYDSLVGERGQSLSGGERQRISIARALLTDPRILILDEATSSVDTETELEIQEALDNLTRGRTTIAIAHRLSTLRRASRLVVMEAGRIVEVGQHDALLEREGAYARLHKAQLELAHK